MSTIRLPWPPAATSPNASGQGKWRRKADAARSYKATCARECLAARVEPMDADAVEVTVAFCPPSARRYDLDNALARAKQGLDAFAAAIGVDDSRWTSMTLERGQPMRGGAVFVTASAVEISARSGDYAARALRSSPRNARNKSGSEGAGNTTRPLTDVNLSKRSNDGC